MLALAAAASDGRPALSRKRLELQVVRTVAKEFQQFFIKL
jgi:hypothetical protein